MELSELMEKRIFPCLDIKKSGTRKEELLLSDRILEPVRALREVLHPLNVVNAIELLRDKLYKTASNDEFVSGLVRSA